MTARTTELGGKVAVVTGASRGIGAEVARAFARAGAAVALAACDADALDVLAAELTATGADVLAVPTDVGDARRGRAHGRADGRALRPPRRRLQQRGRRGPSADAVGRRGPGGLRLGLRRQPARGLPRDEARDPRDAGGRARRDRQPVLDRRAAGRRRARRVRQHQARPRGPHQGGRAGLRGGWHQGQRLAPGPILTENLRRAGEHAQQAAAAAMPVGRIGRTEEVAAAAVWLCSDAAPFVTGTTLVIDGGKLAGTPPFVTTRSAG